MYIGKRFQPGCRALQPETKARLFYDEAGSLRLPQLFRIIWMPRTKIKSAAAAALAALNARIVACTRCPRLREYTANIAVTKRRAYLDYDYWGLPVPSFGDPDARVLLVGLAPGAHGSNRTGRPFTGDASGGFLYPALYRAGFASQPHASSRDDGLALRDCFITAALRCAPPHNMPAPDQLRNCFPYL